MKQSGRIWVFIGMREASCDNVEAVSAVGATLAVNPFSRLGVQPQVRRCPACDSIVYSRRHKLCGVCAAELPEGCLFTEDQAENVSALIREERAQHRSWMRRGNWDH